MDVGLVGVDVDVDVGMGVGWGELCCSSATSTTRGRRGRIGVVVGVRLVWVFVRVLVTGAATEATGRGCAWTLVGDTRAPLLRWRWGLRRVAGRLAAESTVGPGVADRVKINAILGYLQLPHTAWLSRELEPTPNHDHAVVPARSEVVA